MITALDTNVLLDVLTGSPQPYDAAVAALERAAADGALVVCDIVYAELCGHFPVRATCDSFLDSLEIQVHSLGRDALFQSSRAWRLYRRRGGKRARILPDFLIGAHARCQANQLLTRDRGFYADLFPGLRVWDPGVD